MVPEWIKATSLMTAPATNESRPERRTDLDALRGFAMALGIVLHACLSFVPSPWPVQDREQSNWFFLVYAVIHCFRMPLFFILSGFFTMFMFRRYGLGGMLRQRALRILLPLALAMVTIVPVSNMLYRLASETTRVPPGAHDPMVEAILRNDAPAAAELWRQRGAGWVDPVHSRDALNWAAIAGHPEMVELLLEKGAEINARSAADGETALHAAALFANDEAVAVLLAAGADPLARDKQGRTARQKSIAMAKSIAHTAQILGLPEPDEREVALRRDHSDNLLARASGNVSGRTLADIVDSGALWYNRLLVSDYFGFAVGGQYFQVFSTKVFDHLWFLWVLVWLVLGFAAAVKLGFAPTGRRLWLLPVLTLLPQWLMTGIGPDIWLGLLPPPHLVLYYACFFWFGAAVFARDGMATRMGSHWKFLLPVGLLVLLPASFATLGDRLTSTLVQAATAWVVALGAIGIFHRYCSSLGPKTRWLSDASYWMYLAHLPLVIAVQLAIYDRPWPVWGKFLLVNAVVALALLASYRWFIRYTWVGTMLNGSRQRPVPQGS